MGRTAVFNGVELVIPDAYSALDVSRLLTPTSGGVGIVALVGEADGGKPGINLFPGGTSPAVVKRELKSGALADATRLALRTGTDNLVQAGASTVVAYKTNNSTQASLSVGGLADAVAEVYDILFNNGGAFYDVVGVGKHFRLAGGAHHIYFNVTDGINGPQTAPVIVGSTAHVVNILLADTASQIAVKAEAVIEVITGFSSSVSGATVTVTHDTAQAVTPNAVDVNAGVTITTSTEGVTLDTIGAITFTSKQYGSFTNQYTAEIATLLGAKVVTIRDENGVPEVSPSLGSKSYLNFQYTGDASTAVMQLKYVASLLRLQVTLAGDQTDGSVDLDLDVTQLTVGNVLSILSSYVGYTASADVSVQQMKMVDLDLILSNQDVLTADYDFVASIYELIQWADSQSTLVTVSRGSENNGDTVPGTLATSAFTGGSRGTTSNSAHQAALNALLGLRINILVPLFSKDNQDGSTVTVSAINAQVKDHVTSRSGILGRSECQAYVSVSGNKTVFKAECAAMNSRWVSCTSQKIRDLDINGEIKLFDEWAFAVVCAQTQAGSPIGTDLTYRALPVLDITQDVSWNPTENGPELIKAGALIAGRDENNVIRVIAGYTSWLADDNNANIYIETVESLAIFAFNHRQFMKQRFLGQSAFTRQDILDAIQQSLTVERDTTRSIKNFDFEQTTIIQASAGRLEYEVAVVPFEGIKFVLPTVVAIRETA